MTMTIARILARYLSGALAAYGVFSPDTASQIALDPDTVVIISGALAAVTEAAYAFAKRKGWAT